MCRFTGPTDNKMVIHLTFLLRLNQNLNDVANSEECEGTLTKKISSWRKVHIILLWTPYLTGFQSILQVDLYWALENASHWKLQKTEYILFYCSKWKKNMKLTSNSETTKPKLQQRKKIAKTNSENNVQHSVKIYIYVFVSVKYTCSRLKWKISNWVKQIPYNNKCDKWHVTGIAESKTEREREREGPEIWKENAKKNQKI